MARPLVLGRTDHPTIWTPVYADVTDPKMTDWLWEQRESEEQKERFLNRGKHSREEQDRRYVKKPKRWHDQTSGLQEYKLMTSVSMPVFDRRRNAVRFLFVRYFVNNVQNRPTERRQSCVSNVVDKGQPEGLIKIPLC